jgi:hypothetical protein
MTKYKEDARHSGKVVGDMQRKDGENAHRILCMGGERYLEKIVSGDNSLL